MASTTQTAQNQQRQVREKGFIGKTLSLPFAFIGVLLGSLIVSIVMEWIGLYFYWPDQGWHHARDMLNNELRWISTSFVKSLVLDNPGRTARELIDFCYLWAFEKTGLIDWVSYSANQARLNSANADGISQFLGRVYVHIEDYALAAVYTCLTFLARLVILVLAIPLFLMAAFTGVVDGLVRRDLRRFGAGRESGFIYHRAKMLIVPLLVAPWVIYLALPVSLSPIFVVLPAAVVLGSVISVTAGSFKKYL